MTPDQVKNLKVGDVVSREDGESSYKLMRQGFTASDISPLEEATVTKIEGNAVELLWENGGVTLLPLDRDKDIQGIEVGHSRRPTSIGERLWRKIDDLQDELAVMQSYLESPERARQSRQEDIEAVLRSRSELEEAFRNLLDVMNAA
jgi:hypothetical protein